MFTDWRQLPAASDALQMGGLIWRGIVAWNKGGGARAPHKGYFRHQCEYIVWGTNGKCPHAKHAGPYPGCYDFPVRQKDKFHLTGKPTPLMEELVQIVPEEAVILDPGHLLLAWTIRRRSAKKHNRQYIGFEKTDVYYDIAEKRIADV